MRVDECQLARIKEDYLFSEMRCDFEHFCKRYKGVFKAIFDAD